MAHTKKVGVTGKYGTRAGKKLRDKIKKVHQARKDSKCRQCDGKVKRLATGIWFCKKCNLKFTGGAYST